MREGRILSSYPRKGPINWERFQGESIIRYRATFLPFIVALVAVWSAACGGKKGLDIPGAPDSETAKGSEESGNDEVSASDPSSVGRSDSSGSSIQPTASPTPTATPSPTPIPITYQLEQGTYSRFQNSCAASADVWTSPIHTIAANYDSLGNLVTVILKTSGGKTLNMVCNNGSAYTCMSGNASGCFNFNVFTQKSYGMVISDCVNPPSCSATYTKP